jgi:hypothetical protein
MASCPGNEYKEAKLVRSLQKPEFTDFIRPWLERARNEPDPFTALIHLWVAFNAWMAEVIDQPKLMERDLALINAAARDARLNAQFDVMLERDQGFRGVAEEFRSLWPVFNVRRLDQLGIGPWWKGVSRGEYRESCFDGGAGENHYKPGCFAEHQATIANSADNDANLVPLDWPHALLAIYQVRCNLFHGGKTFRMESDLHFARMAFHILWATWGSQFSV